MAYTLQGQPHRLSNLHRNLHQLNYESISQLSANKVFKFDISTFFKNIYCTIVHACAFPSQYTQSQKILRVHIVRGKETSDKVTYSVHSYNSIIISDIKYNKERSVLQQSGERPNGGRFQYVVLLFNVLTSLGSAVSLDSIVKNTWTVFWKFIACCEWYNICWMQYLQFNITFFFIKFGMNIWCEVGVSIEVLYLITLTVVDMI